MKAVELVEYRENSTNIFYPISCRVYSRLDGQQPTFPCSLQHHSLVTDIIIQWLQVFLFLAIWNL